MLGKGARGGTGSPNASRTSAFLRLVHFMTPPLRKLLRYDVFVV